MHRVRQVAEGDETTYRDGVLTVSTEQATAVVADPALGQVRLAWASPGQSIRLVKVLDCIEPRTKGPGGGGIFPGFLGPSRPQGQGFTHVLGGCAVVAAGHLPRAQEGVVDMSGPLAPMSPLGSTHNLVLEFDPAEGAPWDEVESAVRLGLLRLAAWLAESSLDHAPDEQRELVGPGSASVSAGLPRVGAITNLQTQGAFKNTFVYGRHFGGSLPALIDPGELDDGAVVSGQYGHPALKNPTFIHQNNPVVAQLRRRHGHDLSFAGLVLSPEPVDQTDKELVAGCAARLCRLAGFDAAVVTKEGGGNADADVALKMDALEDAGVAAVGLFAEMSGQDGTGPPVVVAPERATAMVSTGNYDYRMAMPAMERALGGKTVDLLDRPATDAMELPLAAIYCSLSPLGWGNLTASARAGTGVGP